MPSVQASTEPNRYIDVQMLGINDFHGQLDTVKKLTIKMQGIEYLGAYLRDRENKIRIH